VSAFDDLVSIVVAAGEPVGQWAVGTVTDVAPGAAADSNALVTVTWRGASVQVPYGDHYTPAVGHVVLMARYGPQLAIVCRLIGTPPT